MLDIFYYIQGNVRYILYYSWFKWTIRTHILDQIEFRLMVMNPKCYLSGSCVMCGCQTPHLQMSNKKCDGGCYPKMSTKKEYEA